MKLLYNMTGSSTRSTAFCSDMLILLAFSGLAISKKENNAAKILIQEYQWMFPVKHAIDVEDIGSFADRKGFWKIRKGTPSKC